MKKITLIFSIVLFACVNRHNGDKNIYEVVAVFGNNKITTLDIDTTIKQELFDELYKIYIYRVHALEETLAKRLEDAEAKKYKKNKDSIFQAYVQKRYTSKAETDFINSNELSHGIPVITRTLTYKSINTKEGKELLRRKLIQFFYKCLTFLR